MKIYTRTGDRGMTSLVGGERVFKSDQRVEAYGTVDELSAFTALLADYLREEKALEEYVGQLHRILSLLMSVEALLACGDEGAEKVKPLPEEAVGWLEKCIDEMDERLPKIFKFTLPGGDKAVSMSHVCRTVCRRAEREALRIDPSHAIDPTALQFLNRLSDYFYLLGRVITETKGVEEILWIP